MMMDKVEMPDGALNIIESGHLILRNTHTKNLVKILIMYESQ